MIDHRAPRHPVLEQRGDVLEENAFGRKVLDIADLCREGGDVHSGFGSYLLASIGATQKPLPRSAEEPLRQVAQIRDHQIRVRGGRPAARRQVHAAHPRPLRAGDVGVRIVAHMRGVPRFGAEGGEGAPEDLRGGLAIADLVRVRDHREVPEEIVTLEDLAKDDAGVRPVLETMPRAMPRPASSVTASAAPGCSSGGKWSTGSM